MDRNIYPEFVFHWGKDLWLVVLALVTALLVLYVLWRDLTSFRIVKNRKLLLATATVVMILLIFLAGKPSVTFYKIRLRELKGVFLIDDSMSMGLATEHGTRLRWVRDFLSRNYDELKVINRFLPLEFYSWGREEKKLLSVPRDTLSPSLLRTALGRVSGDQPESNLRDALKKFAGKSKIAWFFVLSDGVVEGDVRSKFQLYVAYPSAFPFRDISILRVDTPPIAYVRTPVNLDLTIYSNFDTERSVAVEVLEDGKFVKSKELKILPGERKYTVTVRPNFTGEHIYTLRINPDGDRIRENNTYSVILRVLLDRIRVLQVVGRPTWDSRFLRLYLKNDPRIDLISFTILRSNSDNPMSGEDELSLIPFPSNMLFSSELNNFDVVILQNFNYGEYFFLNAYSLLDNLRKFVVKRGGGLVLIGGDLSFSEGGYGGTPVDSVMPVFIPETRGEVYTGKVKMKLTGMGALHPVTSLGLRPSDALDLWKKVPPMDGENLVSGLREGGVPLLEDPSNGNIVIAVRDVGRGRTMSIATDSLWEMAFRSDDDNVRRAYFQFWKRAIRWLIKDENFRQIQISADPQIAYPGKKVVVNVKAFQNDFTAFKKDELKSYIMKDGRVFKKLSLVGSNGIYSTDVTFEEPGDYNLVVQGIKDGKSVAENSARIIVKNPYAEEVRDIRINRDRIKGKELSRLDRKLLVDDVLLAPDSRMIVGREDVPLYGNGYIIFAIMLLFGLYWIFRRKTGLL